MTAQANCEPGGRDYAILSDLLRVRLLTGHQIERLHFMGLSTGNARGSARRRTMRRLVMAGLVTALPRRVGGERAGSRGLVYALDSQGHRILLVGNGRVRRPWPIGWSFVRHTLAVAELYVRLREGEAANQLRLLQFETEPAAWYRSGDQLLKPDAFAVMERGPWEEHLWLEVDRDTESLPSLQRKLARYVETAATPGSSGPLGVLPQVQVVVPTAARYKAVQELVERRLPDPAGSLIVVTLFATTFIEARPP